MNSLLLNNYIMFTEPLIWLNENVNEIGAPFYFVKYQMMITLSQFIAVIGLLC